jgi:hypothetical protein
MEDLEPPGLAIQMFALAKPPSMSWERNKKDLEPPGLATQMLDLAKPPSMLRGGGIRKT